MRAPETVVVPFANDNPIMNHHTSYQGIGGNQPGTPGGQLKASVHEDLIRSHAANLRLFRQLEKVSGDRGSPRFEIFATFAAMIGKTNLAKDLLKEVALQLTDHYTEEEAAAVARILFEDRFGFTRTSMALDPYLRISESGIVRLHKDLRKLKSGMPVQYVTGNARFCGLSFRVEPGILIPRQETEELVKLCAEALCDLNEPMVIDFCTGSGAIAVAIKKSFPASHVFATDYQAGILEIASYNALKNNVVIDYFQHDLLTGELPASLSHFDLVVSNPPYIPESFKADLAVQVKDFEPSAALFVPDGDPVCFYRRLAEYSMEILRPGGVLLVETDHRYNASVAGLFSAAGFGSVASLTDLSGKERFVTAMKNLN
ncbi:MAG TPA: peptide chain release factor N(5)-glutamine methyltransferase [Bacteroidales bacterium]|nr:peptide chain release factor N(5)-glutamine methyltransferase [Bacteroidales bacterium]HRZ50245.1 peptide chain release factor N(5)-glutamine methyltransferase [Bacteroidales bacterium]